MNMHVSLHFHIHTYAHTHGRHDVIDTDSSVDGLDSATMQYARRTPINQRKVRHDWQPSTLCKEDVYEEV